MKTIVVLVRCILDIISIPLRICYHNILRPTAFKIVKDDIDREKEKSIAMYNEIQSLKNENKALNSKINRIKGFVERYKEYNKEVFLSDNNELIFIFENRKIPFDFCFLCAENGSHETNDSIIYLNVYGNDLKICDFISNTKKKGYAKILLNYLKKKAFDNGIEGFYGDLSPIDEDNFEWLIPFYESMGFQYEQVNLDNFEIMKGRIYMDIKKANIS
jgi:hypothetical protein